MTQSPRPVFCILAERPATARDPTGDGPTPARGTSRASRAARDLQPVSPILLPRSASLSSRLRNTHACVVGRLLERARRLTLIVSLVLRTRNSRNESCHTGHATDTARTCRWLPGLSLHRHETQVLRVCPQTHVLRASYPPRHRHTACSARHRPTRWRALLRARAPSAVTRREYVTSPAPSYPLTLCLRQTCKGNMRGGKGKGNAAARMAARMAAVLCRMATVRFTGFGQLLVAFDQRYEVRLERKLENECRHPPET